MNNIDIWIAIWKWILIIGLGSFFLLALVVLPFGARDLLRLFRRLDDPSREADDDSVSCVSRRID
jgi:hypothetical protein